MQDVVENWQQRVKQEKDGQEEEGDPDLSGLIKFRGPAQRHHDRSGERREVEAAPAFEVGDCDYSGVEQRNVGEQANRIVHTRRKQHWRQESANESQHGYRERVQSHR